ncbi:MAG: RNHCP domain-containing protein [Candidatus Doudnabacteria bacterium]|nr:RNHCP domain-containing protein [Candidatus Doudnabacteria bacterium]
MLMKLFQKRTEDFVCGNCGYKAAGNGYTNHCPKCLYSKHVDVNPGDRSEPCGGLMRPMGVEMDHGEYIILHKCLQCRVVRKNKIAKEDDFDKVSALSGGLKISRKPSKL